MASTRERRPGAGNNMKALVDFDKPRAKRTHDEVVAEEAERTAAAQALARKREEAMALIASIDVQLDAAKVAEEADAIDGVSDLPRDAMEERDSPAPHGYDEDTPMLDATQEHFDRIEDDDAYLSESQWGHPEGKGKAVAVPKRARKPGKYETRKTIEALGKTLAMQNASATDVVKKKGVQNSDAAAASTKAGLSKSWTTKASTGPSAIGGLTDEDAEAARPEFEAPETVHVLRKNTMVGLVDLSNDDDTPTKLPARLVPAKAVCAPVKVEARTSRIPVLNVRPRKSNKTPSKAVVKTDSLSSSYSPFTPQSSADVNGLPSFITRTWVSKFLPRCYLILYMSQDPMALGAVGDDPKDPGRATVNALQAVLDDLYPEIRYNLEWEDMICSKAVSRIREERSKFAKRGMTYTDAQFEDPKYYIL
ncbi:hypothetical protein C8R44DRAFT_987917 [Mycena epipterygia]|nr:hypothetical protein C8R44DRAFT_987917 [Mycena epipterygia]